MNAELVAELERVRGELLDLYTRESHNCVTGRLTTGGLAWAVDVIDAAIARAKEAERERA